ncbi:MAG: hopanoid C-3 methylase HpnR [Myxococcales bacterium]|nr:hopanoid C-3 methylase HpnR [Myxococcales bacterium]
MRVLAVHPSALMHSEVFLRLEPLGLERVAQAIRAAGHDVRVLDLQVYGHRHYFAAIRDWRPDAVAFSLNYLANIPEVLDLAKATKRALPACFVFTGGHSVSFVADEVLAHAGGAIDCVARGEGEVPAPLVLEAARSGGLASIPGVVTAEGRGPEPVFVERLEDHPPARDLMGRRRRYFIGHLDPCASIEFTRGCPWDCSFCSAWTFYGRSYRKLSVETAVEEMASIREPNVFIVDDVAFVDGDQGMAIAEGIERRGIRKHYYLETRADVLLRHPEVFERWARLGLDYMFLGVEALDEEGLKAFRKRSTMSKNFEALDRARRIGIDVAINIIADPAWDHKRFEALRAWAMEVPEMVHVTVQTPYPGTEIWHTESRKLTTLDYRLFDVQHAVLPTAMPLQDFYRELVATQSVLNRKHLGMKALVGAARIAADCLRRGQTNFVKMLWKFPTVYNAERQFAEHQRPLTYSMRPPAPLATHRPAPRDLYVHAPAEAPRPVG